MFLLTLADKIIPILTWMTITFPVWMSPFHPAIVAYFIIAFDVYFLFKSFDTSYHATISYQKILAADKIDFKKNLAKIKNKPKIKHFIIIPNYKEPLHILERTIDSFIRSDYDPKNIYLVLAFEKRESEAKDKAFVLNQKYEGKFADILVTYHELLPHEISGKASNQTYASKFVDQYIKKNYWLREEILMTICDADSCLPKNYFSYLTFKYLTDKDHLYHFYWAPVFLYNNFWKLAFFVRMQATLSSILRLAFLSQKDRLIQTSTYSTNLWLLNEVGFWDVDIIPEDWHINLQAFFKFGDRVKTIPLYTIVNGDAVSSGSVYKTFINRYEQEKRWAWGVTDVSYSIKRYFDTPKIESLSKIKKIFYVVENHLLWPVSFFILTVSASIPPLINPVFKRTVLGFLLPKMAGLILTLSTVMIALYIYLDIKIRQKVNQKTPLSSLPGLFVQWYLLPVVSFLLSSLPALDAHTRLLLGKKIKYKVTEKV